VEAERRPRRGRRIAPTGAPLLALAFLAGCATPLRPSGGPEDRTPPRLLASEPAAGAVRVSSRRIVLTFSERVDEASLRRALSVAPAPILPPDVRTRGREAEILLRDSLRSDITYVLTIGSELRDLHGVMLPAALTLAFATGDRIDAGRIEGSVSDAASGRALAGLTVVAHRAPADSSVAPDPRTAIPHYRSQTAADGSFALGYLRSGRYFIAALDDRDRDGLADAGEAFAAPPTPAIAAADSGDVPRLTLFLLRADTTGPQLRGARAEDDGVVARFDETVALGAGAAGAFALEDSASGRAVAIAGAWLRPEDRREVLLESGPLAPTRYTLTVAPHPAVADSSGNVVAAGRLSLTPRRTPADTARARFIRFLPEAPVAADSTYLLVPGEQPGVRFSRAVDTLAARGRLAVRDASGATAAFRVSRADASSVQLEIGAVEYVVTVGSAERHYRAATSDDLGAIVGRVAGAGADGIVEVVAEGAGRRVRRTVRTDVAGAFAHRGLPPGAYRLRVMIDRDGDATWDGGRLAPYASPEPMGWLPGTVRVRARWDTDLGAITLGGGTASAEHGDEQGREEAQ